MRNAFKDTFAKVCNLSEMASEELHVVQEFNCNSIENFDKEYKKARETLQAALNSKDTPQFKNYAEEIDRIASESNVLATAAAGPSILTLADGMEVEEQNVLEMIDPMTKKQILNPVKNVVCNHVYEEASIHAAIRVNPRTKCPYLGCGNKYPVRSVDLVLDDELRRKIDVARTQQVEHEESMRGNDEDSD